VVVVITNCEINLLNFSVCIGIGMWSLFQEW